jgi:hypothetical protein
MWIWLMGTCSCGCVWILIDCLFDYA